MIFPIPSPTLWTDPGPLPCDGLARRLWLLAGEALIEPRQEWVDLWLAKLAKWEQEAEAYQMQYDQWEQEQLIRAQYQARGEEIATMLPYELHYMGISYRRNVQDRKDSRPYEKVDYCTVCGWSYDDYAFYFNIATWYPYRPIGVTIRSFFRGADDREIERPGQNHKENPVAQTLAGAYGAAVTIEFNSPDHKTRPGLWIIVEHRAGRGQIPNRVSYQQMMQAMPKGADPLSYPVGVGRNKAMYIDDLGEVYNLGVGGSVGGGKSNFINVVLCTFISRNHPKDLRLFLVDFKRVELAFYKGIDHLGGDTRIARRENQVAKTNQGLYIIDTVEETEAKRKANEGRLRTVPPDYQPKDSEKLGEPMGRKIVTTGGELVSLLDYLLAEIERRTLLMQGKVKKISTWNKRFPHKKLSYWVMVIDEFADVMLQPRWKAKVEPRLIRVIQLGRAMGVHCLIATQTPKSSVITGLIQNNITAWLALRCGNGHASALMLDGKWDAANLPAIRGRGILREGDIMREVQTPEITDMTVRAIVKAAKNGETYGEAAPKQYAIAADEVFKYALKEFDGYCSRDDLFKAFRKQNIPFADINGILNDYEVSGSPGHFEPEIEIEETLYYLSPPVGGIPRRLMEVDIFTSDFDKKYAAVLAVRRASGAKNGKHPNTDESKTGEPLTSLDATDDNETYDLFDDTGDDELAEELQEEFEEEYFQS